MGVFFLPGFSGLSSLDTADVPSHSGPVSMRGLVIRLSPGSPYVLAPLSGEKEGHQVILFIHVFFFHSTQLKIIGIPHILIKIIKQYSWIDIGLPSNV